MISLNKKDIKEVGVIERDYITKDGLMYVSIEFGIFQLIASDDELTPELSKLLNNNMKIIDSFRGEYSWLSNFSPHSFEDTTGRVCQTVEHFYQAHKAKSQKDFDLIWCASTPNESKKLEEMGLTSREIRNEENWQISLVVLQNTTK